jgi:putative flavoprotein involved in K+ transport
MPVGAHVSVLGAVVVGAGQAGLATSYHLGRLGVDHVVLERGQVGETWRTQRWDSFALNTPGWLNPLPGDPGDATERDAFASGAAFVGRLATFAERHGLPVRTESTVVDVASDGTGDGFVVSVRASGEAGRAERIRARSVVVASGALNVAKVPPISSALPAGLLQLTGATYRNSASLPPGAVLVVGSAQSGVQIVEDLLEAGRTVYLCTSAVNRMRRRYRGRDAFFWLEKAGFWEMTIAGLPDPAMRWWPNPQTSGVGPSGHTVSLQWLAARGAVLLGRPRAVEGSRLVLDDTVGAAIAHGDRGSAMLMALMDRAIASAGLEPPSIEPDPADEPHPDPASLHSPATLDLRKAAARSVIWATGFGGAFPFLPAAALDAHGRPINDGGVGPLPGLFHVGYPWLTKRRSGIIGGVDEDGASIAGLVAGRLAGARAAAGSEG